MVRQELRNLESQNDERAAEGREHLADRLLALEVAIVAAAATVATIPALGGSDRFVDLALVLGLVGFTSTLAAARYLEHHDGNDR